MDTRWRNIGLAYAGLIVINELWGMISDKPLLLGLFDLLHINSTTSVANTISKSWILIISVVIFIMIFAPAILDRVMELTKIYNKHYKNETIILDGKHYINCTFEDCKIRWNGKKYLVDECKWIGYKQFQTDNGTITDTMVLFRALGFLEEKFAKSFTRVPKGEFK